MGHHEFTNTEGYERRANLIGLPVTTPRSLRLVLDFRDPTSVTLLRALETADALTAEATFAQPQAAARQAGWLPSSPRSSTGR
jgi:hypothetical protein